MYFRITLIVFILVLMYLAVYFYKVVTGLSFYYVQVLAYTLVFSLTWSSVREYIKLNRLSNVVFFFTISYISIYMLMGMAVGYGLSPYSMTPLGVLVNIIYTTSRFVFLEFLRLHIADILRYKHRLLSLYLPTFAIWFLMWFPYPLLAISLDLDSLKTIFRYLIPSFISNIYSTFLILNDGFVSSLIYNLLPQLFMKITPYLPKLDWLIEGTLNTFTPLLGYYIALPYTRIRKRSLKLLKLESRRTVRLIIYFVVIMSFSMILQGYLGFRLFTISSESMKPVLNVGDVVIVCNYCKDLKEGDVVAYLSEFGVIVHRVVEVSYEYSYLITKGDANRNVDPKPVPFENVLGKVVYSIPWIGYLSIYTRRAISSEYSLVLFTVLVVLMGVYGILRYYRHK